MTAASVATGLFSGRNRRVTGFCALTAAAAFAALALFLPAPPLRPVLASDLAAAPSAYEGKFLYFTGPLTPLTPREDKAFNISERTVLLKRKVTVFVTLPGERAPAWTENKRFVPHEMKAGGYGFLKDVLWQADDWRIGSVPLSKELARTFTPELQTRALTIDDYNRLSPKRKRQFFLSEGLYFRTGGAKEPALGDQRVSYETAGAPIVSVLGTVRNGALEPYIDGDFHAGFIRAGIIPPEEMSAGLATPEDGSAVLAPRLAAALLFAAAGVVGVFLLRGEHMRPLAFISKLAALARKRASHVRSDSGPDALEERLQPAKTPPARSRALDEATEREPLPASLKQAPEHFAVTNVPQVKIQTSPERRAPASPPTLSTPAARATAAKSAVPASPPSFSLPATKPFMPPPTENGRSVAPTENPAKSTPTPAPLSGGPKKPATIGVKNAGAARVRLTPPGAPKENGIRYPSAQPAAEKL